MKWPRGRYNGRRIVGIEFYIVIDVTDWRWIPVIGHHVGMFHWLFWRSWTQAAYESEWRAERKLHTDEQGTKKT